MEKIVSRSFIVLVSVSLLSYLCHFMLLTSISDMTQVIGGSKTDVGLVAGAYTLAAILARPLLGKLLDTFSRKLVLAAGLLLIAVAAVVYPFLAVVPLLIVFRALNGVGFSAFTTATGTLAADIVPRNRLNEGVALIGIAGPVATALGPLLGLFLFQRSSGTFFGVIAGASLLAAGLALLIRPSGVVAVPRSQPAGQSKFIERSAFRFLAPMILLYLPLDAVMIFLANYGVERKFDQIGLFFVVHAMGMMLSKVTLSRLADRIGPNRVLLGVMILGIAALVLLAFATTDLTMLIASFIFGLAMGINVSLLNSTLLRLSPRGSLGAANATFLLFGDIGAAVGTVIMSAIVQNLGFTAFFLAAAGCFVLSMIAYGVFVWKKARI